MIISTRTLLHALFDFFGSSVAVLGALRVIYMAAIVTLPTGLECQQTPRFLLATILSLDCYLLLLILLTLHAIKHELSDMLHQHWITLSLPSFASFAILSMFLILLHCSL